MEEKWMILLLAVTAHVNLGLMFVPSFWDPVKRSGRRFSTLVGPLGMPVLFALMIALDLFDAWSTLPTWARFVGPMGIAACSAAVIIGLKVLKNLESRRSA